MWINFRAMEPFAIKIYVGGVNAISGELAAEDEQTMCRRSALLAEGKSVQDYIVVPQQKWLDGIANTDGTVRQFVAMPMGSGYSVETQIRGMDCYGGLQFEITPLSEVQKTKRFQIFIRDLKGSTQTFEVTSTMTVARLKQLFCDNHGIPPGQQSFIYAARRLQGKLVS
jgi:hypothetical protein